MYVHMCTGRQNYQKLWIKIVISDDPSMQRIFMAHSSTHNQVFLLITLSNLLLHISRISGMQLQKHLSQHDSGCSRKFQLCESVSEVLSIIKKSPDQTCDYRRISTVTFF